MRCVYFLMSEMSYQYSEKLATLASGMSICLWYVFLAEKLGNWFAFMHSVHSLTASFTGCVSKT